MLFYPDKCGPDKGATRNKFLALLALLGVYFMGKIDTDYLWLHDEVMQLLMRDRELDSELQQLRSFPVLTVLGAHRWAPRAQGSNAALHSPPRSAPGRFP